MMSDLDMNQLLKDIKANSLTLDSCELHRFDPVGYTFGKPMFCVRCGGKIDAVAVGWYIKGYEAGGGSCDDIWPGYRTPRNKA